MSGFGLIKQFPSPGYEVWEDWREYYLDACEVFMWSEEEVKRFLPDKLCGWALDALNYLPRAFWKTDQRNRAWTLQETLYFFDLRLSNNPKFYEDAFERYLIEKEEYEKAALKYEIDRPVFPSDVVDREELPLQERTPKSDKMKDVQVKTDIIVKSVMYEKTTKISSTKRWSAIKAVGFGVKAVLDEKPIVRVGNQGRTTELTDNSSGVETVADSNVIGGSRNFGSDGETEEQITTKTKSEDERVKEMMDRCIARWDIGKNMKIVEMRSEALEEINDSEVEDDANLSEDDFSDDDSFFDSDDENKFECMDDDVVFENIFERHINSKSLELTTKNGLKVGKQCSKGLIASEYVTSGPCMPYFGKWIDVGETAMPHFSVAQKGELATAAENIFSGNLIANSSRQGIVSTGSQHFDHISVTRTSEDNSEKLQGSFVSFPTDGADRKATQSCGSKAAKANSDGFLEESKEEKSATAAKSGGNFFSENCRENEVDEKDKFENEDSKRNAIVGGSGDTIQEDELVFETLRQQLAPENFKVLENRSFDAEIAVADESVFGDVLEHSTAEELVKSYAFINERDGSGDGSGDVVCGLVQMKLEEPDRKKKCSLSSETQLLQSDEKKLELSFSYAANDGTPQSNQFERSAVEQSLMLGQGSVSTPEEILFRKYSTSESDCEVLQIQKGKFGDDKSVSLSKEIDLELKLLIDGENSFSFDFGENVVPVQFESSYSKQDNKREQSSDFEVKKAVKTGLKRFSMGVFGREEIVQNKREVSYSSSPNLLRASDDQRSVDLEYPELYKLLFRKQKVSRKEKWNKLKTRCYSSRGFLRKRMKKSKNENGGGHPFKHRRKKVELTKLVKLNCLW